MCTLRVPGLNPQLGACPTVLHRAFHLRARRVRRQVVELFQQVASSVPAYQKFLRDKGIEPSSIQTVEDFRRLPLLDKESYRRRYQLPELCRDGRLHGCDMIAVSSGSSGSPTIWPRSLRDELHIARRFEQVFRDGFHGDSRSTLAVVCFPLGTWVGGLFTTACVRHLAAKGYPITVVAPGNNTAEIFRVLPELAPHFELVVLLGYPPFVKDVLPGSTGPAMRSSSWPARSSARNGVTSWPARRTRRSHARLGFPLRYGGCGRAGQRNPALCCDPAFSRTGARIVRRFTTADLVQYDPGSMYFENHDGMLLFSGDNGLPLIRYHIADEGGIVPCQDMLDFCARHGFDPLAAAGGGGHPLPFVFIFGRSLFTVLFFGANIYPENVTVGLDQPEISAWVTGKFVLETVEDADRDRWLRVTVELAPGRDGDPAVLAASIRTQLLRLNSEFAQYVPAERQQPEVVLRPAGGHRLLPDRREAPLHPAFVTDYPAA
jgi:phenylacetate-CoA ligase